MVHINMPCLNLGTCSVICVWMCLHLGISSLLMQTYWHLLHDKSLDDVLPKCMHRANYLQDFYLTFCTLLKILHKISRIVQKRVGQYKKKMCCYYK